MPKPTLLTAGYLRANNPQDTELQRELDQVVPIDHIMEWIRKRISMPPSPRNRVLVLQALTGSGKSTALPPTIYSNFYRKGAGDIAVTQPRVLTAISIPKDIVASKGPTDSKNYPDMVLGKTIGWQTGPSRRKPTYGVNYMTVGVLTQQLRVMSDNDFMRKYRFIVLDECHEMSLELALAVYLLRNLLMRNQNSPNLPFIVAMSATFTPEKFLRYFDVYDEENFQPNFIWVTGFAYEKVTHWLPYATTNYVQSAIETAEKIHCENPDDEPEQADILVFMPSPAEMSKVAVELNKINQRLATAGNKVFMVLQIDRPTINEKKPDYSRVFLPPDQLRVTIPVGRSQSSRAKMLTLIPQRRIVLSTSVAETGLTIDTLKYCIDSGFHRAAEFNPNHSVDALINKPAAIPRILQRKGRVGRKFPGVFYPLYPEYIYNMLPKEQFSDILVNDISSIFLPLANEQSRGGELLIDEINLIDMPSTDAFALALEKSYALGFVSPLGANEGKSFYALTPLGKVAAQLSKMGPEQIRMILAAFSWGCAPTDLITISAYLSMKAGEFKKPTVDINWLAVYKASLPGYWLKDASDTAVYKTRLLIADDFIDGLLLYVAVSNVVRAADPYDTINKLEKWCLDNNINYSAVMSFIEIRDDRIEQLLNINIDVFPVDGPRPLVDATEGSFMDTVIRIKHCIYDGYQLNLCTYDDKNGDYISMSGLHVTVPPTFTINQYKIAEEKKYGLSTRERPKQILIDGKELKYNYKTKLYDVITERCSVLDGFINPDLQRLY